MNGWMGLSNQDSEGCRPVSRCSLLLSGQKQSDQTRSPSINQSAACQSVCQSSQSVVQYTYPLLNKSINSRQYSSNEEEDESQVSKE